MEPPLDPLRETTLVTTLGLHRPRKGFAPRKSGAGNAAMALAALAASLFLLSQGSPAAHAQAQVALTASYSIIGGGSSGAQDLITFVSEGQQVVEPLSTTAQVYMVDSGSTWSVLAVLNGSNGVERWQTYATDLSGEITVPQTVSFTYYHQYLVSFGYSVTGGGGGYQPPMVTFTQFGTSVTESAAPQWVDSGTAYSYGSSLQGAPQGEEWVAYGTTSGTLSSHQTVTVTYRNEFLITSSYSSLYGSPPSTPQLSTTASGSPYTVAMTISSSGVWADAGANYTFTPSITTSAANERWIGTTQAGANLSVGTYTGKLEAPITVSIVFIHQYLVTVDFSFAAGQVTGTSGPSLAYRSFNVAASTGTNSSMWVDAGSQYMLPQGLSGTTAQERWELDNVTSGYFDQPTKISPVYFHQYYVPFSFAVVGATPPSPSGQPNLSYDFYANKLSVTLTSAPQSEWADVGSSYSTVATLSSSGDSERWFAQDAGGTISSASLSGVTIYYVQQYLLTIHGGALPNQWVDAGSNTTLNTPGVYGRSQGTGYRLISYSVDQGAQVTISQPLLTLSIPISMDGPQSIAFQSTIQFEVSLDTGAQAAVSLITPPTIPGDSGYWYDDGSAIQLVLNGAYGRAHGVGSRITSVSASAEPTLKVDTAGAFEAYNTSSLDSPVSITTTSVAQYEVVLNPAAQAALVSMTPASSFPGDTSWFNAGSPSVTIVLDGAYSRALGVGMRTTSWELDAGGFTKVAQTGQITITTKVLNSAQFVNATSAVQYQVSMDKGGAGALVSISSPTISGDSGWYDSGTQVVVLMSGEWGRSAGTGNRLSAYSLDGGPQVPVSQGGQVEVLNLAGITSTEAITTTVVTQYQLSLDAGATSALSSVTPTPIPSDKYWYDSGTAVAVSFNGVWGRTATSGVRLVSYSVDKGPATAAGSTSPVQAYSSQGIDGPVSITASTALQFHLSSSPVSWTSVTPPTVPGDPGWYDSGTPVKATFNDTWGQQPGVRQSAVSYAVDGGAKTAVARAPGGSFTVSLTMSGAHTIALAGVQQYTVDVVGPQKVSAAPPSPTGDDYFDTGSKETFTTTRVWNGSSPGSENLLVSYSVDGSPAVAVPPSSSSTTFAVPAITFNQDHTLTFYGISEYEVSFLFLDHSGGQQITPSAIGLTEGNSTVQVQGDTAWLVNGTSFAVSSVIWEGASVGPAPPPSFTMKGAPQNITLETYSYPASIRVVDLLGLPVSGAHVSMTLANGTTVSGTTKSNGVYSAGIIPLGTYTAKVSDLGATTHLTGTPDHEVTQGRVALSVISLFVIVAVAAGAGVGGFLGLRRLRKGKVSEPK